MKKRTGFRGVTAPNKRWEIPAELPTAAPKALRLFVSMDIASGTVNLIEATTRFEDLTGLEASECVIVYDVAGILKRPKPKRKRKKKPSPMKSKERSRK